MSDVNPYAPPSTDESAPAKPRKKKKRGSKDLQAAIEALNEYISDPANVEADLKAAGGRLRAVTIVFLALGVGVVMVGLVLSNGRGPGLAIGGMFGFLFLLIGGIAAAMDMSMVGRKEPAEPLAVFRSYVRSLTLARYGYSFACLCPTARDQTVEPPDIAPVVTGHGQFSMSSPEGVKAYAGAFARPGGGNMRSIQIKEMVLASQDDDVATVEATMTFQSWPQWANILLGLGGVFAARIGSSVPGLSIVGGFAALIGLIALLALRKKRVMRVRRTLIRGDNGLWYIYDPNLIEGGEL